MVAERVAGALASRDGGGARVPAGGQRPGHLHVQRGEWRDHRPQPAIPQLLRLDVQCEHPIEVFFRDPQLRQVEHRERASPFKQPIGQGAEPAPVQREQLQPAQPPEDIPGQTAELVPPQPQGLQVIQIVEHAGGQGRQLHSAQCQARQRRQPVEVPDPEGADGLILYVQRSDPVQVGSGDQRAVGHTTNRTHNGVAEGQGATADIGLLHRDGEGEVVGFALAVGDRPGVEACRGEGRRRAGHRAGVHIHGQPDGQVGAGEGIAQDAVAAGGAWQDQGRNGGVTGVDPVHDHRRAEIRHGVGQHRHDHGQGGRVAGGVQGRPGQGHGRGSRGRGAGQGALAGIQGQPGGNGIDGSQ